MPAGPTPTRTAALARLDDFLSTAAPHYGTERNFVRPGHGDVSRLAPWLQRRLLTEEETIARTLARWPFPAVEKFVQEVYWRTYWKGWLEHRPSVWSDWRRACRELSARLSAEQAATLAAARAGTTGLAGFDDWVHELTATGYLHNHARMWFASIWIFTLRLPWELGADFFWQHLLDADAASNTLSWRWVAGLQTAGKTYVATADNIARYTDGRVRLPAHALAATPILLREPERPRLSLWQPAPAATPATARCGLWLHAEDLAVEHGELAALRPGALFAAWPTTLARGAGWSTASQEFSRAGLHDAANRAAAHFQLSADRVTAGTVADLAAALAAWAQREQLTSIVAYRPFVGPWLDATPALEHALRAVGCTLDWHRRAWDTRLFPHAARGFFPFWEVVRSAHVPR